MRHSADFAAAVRDGARVRRGSIVVHLDRSLPGAERGPLVGFVVGKSVGTSVVRHRVTRRLRAVMSARLGHLPRDSRVVVRALPAAASLPSADLAADLDAALARLTTGSTG
jgi:ribonuclease P protein component